MKKIVRIIPLFLICILLVGCGKVDPNRISPIGDQSKTKQNMKLCSKYADSAYKDYKKRYKDSIIDGYCLFSENSNSVVFNIGNDNLIYYTLDEDNIIKFAYSTKEILDEGCQDYRKGSCDGIKEVLKNYNQIIGNLKSNGSVESSILIDVTKLK